MSTRKVFGAGSTSLMAVFDQRLSFHLQTIRREVDGRGSTARGSESLAALQDTVVRLREALRQVSPRRCGDLADRLDELEYPLANLKAFFSHKRASPDLRATQIMAEYLRDRLLEVRIVAKSSDVRP